MNVKCPKMDIFFIKKINSLELTNQMVAPAGIEPATQGFSVLCSTDWAMEPSWRFVRDSNPWSSAWQADVITTTPRNHGCGRRIWTYDLRVMSPTSYQAAPSRDIKIKWRRNRDSNPSAACTTCWFSRPVPSTGLGYSSVCLWQQVDYSTIIFTMSTFYSLFLLKNIYLKFY